MSSYFLVQVNNSAGYPNITINQKYENGIWSKRRRDLHQGFVEPGDHLLVYCTADVPIYGMSLAFQVQVKEVSEDKTVLYLGNLEWFKNQLKRDYILQLVDTGELDEVFRSCGAQGFNIAQIEPDNAQSVLRLLLASDEADGVKGPSQPTSSPLDKLIETKLEQWLVEHWDEVNFGMEMKLYEEDGEPVGQQFDTGVVGRIDLLCVLKESGIFVVIELKRGRPSDEVVGQLARYIGWVQEHLANGHGVKGIILAPGFDEKLRYAVKAIPGTSLLRYQTRFEVFPESN